MIEYLLDTNIVSRIVREPLGALRQRAERVGFHRIGISVIVAAELRFGCIKRRSARLAHDTEALLGALAILPIEIPADEHYGRLRAELERRGTPIGANDMLIAAHALALDCTLVTANEREFRRVPNLRVENWAA